MHIQFLNLTVAEKIIITLNFFSNFNNKKNNINNFTKNYDNSRITNCIINHCNFSKIILQLVNFNYKYYVEFQTVKLFLSELKQKIKLTLSKSKFL